MISFAKITKEVFSKRQEFKHKSRLVLVLLATFIIMFLPLVFGISIGTFRQNTDVELYQTCNDCLYCNITDVKIKSPEKLTLINISQEMTARGTYYYFTLDSGNTTSIGTYEYCYNCGNLEEIAVGCIEFDINPSGITPTTAQGGLSIGILISIIFLMFFFGFLSFKFMESDKGFPIGLFFLLVSIIISIYGLYLGVVFSRDYLYSNVANVQSRIFTGIMYGLVGMTFLGLLTLIIMAVKEIKIRKSKQEYGENYDTNTKMYKY